MRRLKEINIPDLPFKQQLVDGNFTNLVMRHINENYFYKYNDLLLYPIKQQYPKQFTDLLDNSQLNAIHRCLQYKIGLIQGPPGTGKTHVGTILADILLQNLNPGAQILVVCFTNHALDSFIEGILKYTEDIVRIGGRCKNEVVKRKTLNIGDKFSNYKTYRGIVKDLDSIGEEMKEITFLMDVRTRVDYKDVKNRFQELLNRIVSDFFEIVNASFNQINFDIRKNIDLKLYDELKKRIYIFWNFINNNNNKNFPDDIIADLLNTLNIKNSDNYNFFFDKICQNFEGYNKDNITILNNLNNNRYNELIINNFNEENKNEEEEEEDDEEEIQQNLERLDMDFYIDELAKKEMENEINENKELSEENENEYGDIKKLMPLNEETYNYLLNNKTNFFRLGPKIIRLIIDYMKNKLLLDQLKQQNDYFTKFNNLLKKKNEESLMIDAQKIKDYKIVAMTTTGAAKYSTVLEQSNFETIIIEEAAEVLESHILSLLTKNTKQLILIGDHKQLKPKPYNFEIETKYKFNVSMFERLVNNNIPYYSLKYQRRMKPIFADFVRIIYGDNEYLDYKDVLNKEKVKGIEKDMFIITHNQ